MYNGLHFNGLHFHRTTGKRLIYNSDDHVTFLLTRTTPIPMLIF